MRSTPLPKASNSVVALSPVIRHTASPLETLSPSCLSHSAMLPTFMSQPRRGITISIGTAALLADQRATLLQHRAIDDVAWHATAQEGDDVLDRGAPTVDGRLDGHA